MVNSTQHNDTQVSPEDIEAITAVARDFIEAWYAADSDRMKRSLHPDLVKRSLFRDPMHGALRLRRPADASMMVEFTREGGGSETPKRDQTYELSILDTFRHIASVKVESHQFMDYLHIAKIEDAWVIVNDLWELKEGELTD